MAEPIDFAGSSGVIPPGKGTEDRVSPLPAFVSPGGEVLTRWRLTEEEKARVLATGDVWLSIMTFGHPLQPSYVSGFPLMELLHPDGTVAGIYDPDAGLTPKTAD